MSRVVVEVEPPTAEARRLWISTLELASLSFVEDPRALAGDLRKSERRWLRAIEALLAFDDGALADLFPRNDVIAAEQAYQLLVG